MRDLEPRVQRLAALCPQALRSRARPEIIAVSKGQSKEKIIPLLKYGHRIFGENRLNEAQEKWAELKRHYPDIQLHFIGQLQTNKIDHVLGLFDAIHSLDRPKLARALKRRQEQGVKLPPLFIQINIGREPQKAGIDPDTADDFIADCLKNQLPIIGLMCLPPHAHNPAPYFALLQQIAARHRLGNLSMGMSDDLEAALLLGATHIRLGRLIFGAR